MFLSFFKNTFDAKYFKKKIIPNSGREEVIFYEFYMMLNQIVKMYMPCYGNLGPTFKKSQQREMQSSKL